MWILFVLLSTFAWALVNTLNSVLVHHHIKSPIVLTWTQSLIGAPILLFIAINFDVNSSWIPTLVFFGITAYAADLWFFYVLEHVDVSVLNASWSILSILLSFAGFLFLNETWTIYQSLGTILIIGGTLILSFNHKHVNVKYTVGLFLVLALLYTPYYLVKKLAVEDGQTELSVFFWLLLGREILSISLPIFSTTIRKSAISIIRSNRPFLMICMLITCLYFAAEYFGVLAYANGPLSLVSIVINTQPFAVMVIAAIYTALSPNKAPKELLTRQSINVKIVSFLVVFIGLLLIAF
jgi:drug/metabolite transporter (DMT)-like permease